MTVKELKEELNKITDESLEVVTLFPNVIDPEDLEDITVDTVGIIGITIEDFTDEKGNIIPFCLMTNEIVDLIDDTPSFNMN